MSEETGSFFHELKRRNMFRVAIAYLASSWVLLQVLDVIVPMLGLPAWVGPAALSLLAIGFPIALILAWVFELTPEGIVLDEDADHGGDRSRHAGRILDFIIIGVLATGLSFSVYLNLVDRQTAKDAASIAVLPLDNRSANGEDVFFVDGIHDELLTSLAKISSLKVISRTSVLQYRDTEKSMKVIGDELGASSLVEGAVQRVGDRIRINVQLIDSQTDQHLWAESYDRELTANNIFEIQEEISSEIARSLDATLLPDEQRRLADRPTGDLAAYEAYLVGRQKLGSQSPERIRDAVDDFQRAIDIDIGFVQAYVGLAESYVLLSELGDISQDDMLRRVRQIAEMALELDDRDGGVYNLLGTIAEYDGDIEQAETYYRRAIDLAPEYSMVRLWLGIMLRNHTLRLEESADMYRQALELDPLGADIRASYGMLLTEMGDIDGGLDNLKMANDINPDLIAPYVSIGYVLFFGRGDAVRAMLWQQKAASMEASRAAHAANLYAALGDFESARDWIEPVLATYPDHPNALAATIGIAIAEGDVEGARAVADFALDVARDSLAPNIPLYAYRNAALQRSDPESARAAYVEYYPALGDEDPDIEKGNVVAAVDLVLVLLKLGRDEEAAIMSRNINEYLAQVPSGPSMNAHALRAELAAMNGDTSAALQNLRLAIDENWLGYWWASPDQNPNLSYIHDEPEYLAMMREIQEELAGQLARIRELQSQGRLAATPGQLSSVTIELPVD